VNFANPSKIESFFPFVYRGADQQERKIKMNPEKRHTSFGQTKKKNYIFISENSVQREREMERC
jgi:hypothetical protein